MKTSIVAIIGAFLAGVIALGSGAQSRPTSPGSAERIIAIIGGDFASRAEAVAVGGALPFGDIQGFSVARSDGFDGEPPGRWLLVSGFRTVRGAAEFEELLRVLRIDVVRRIVTTYRGSDPIGLGQEPHPNGDGPLLSPLPPEHPERLG
jgi:hypothetical protein